MTENVAAEVAMIRDVLGDAKRKAADAIARSETAEKKLAEMRSIVEWMEWKGCWEYGEFCPECGRTPLIEHQRSCSIRKALGR